MVFISKLWWTGTHAQWSWRWSAYGLENDSCQGTGFCYDLKWWRSTNSNNFYSLRSSDCICYSIILIFSGASTLTGLPDYIFLHKWPTPPLKRTSGDLLWGSNNLRLSIQQPPRGQASSSAQVTKDYRQCTWERQSWWWWQWVGWLDTRIMMM